MRIKWYYWKCFVRPDDIPENLIDLDKELPIYDNEFKIKIEYFLDNPPVFYISRRPNDKITLRGLLETIEDCVKGNYWDYDIEGLYYNHLTKELEIHWGS